jgi:hypothetical protein
MNTLLPQQFTQLSLHSLTRTNGPIVPTTEQISQQSSDEEHQEPALKLGSLPIFLKPSRNRATVAAVDTSTIKIAETAEGAVIAVRGANIWKQDDNYRYSRIGPFIFHITEANRKEVYNSLERSCFNKKHEYDHQSAPSMMQIPMRIAGLLERWLQTALTKTLNNGLILFDGSLVAGTPDTPIHRMSEILRMGRERSNIVLAFTKMTNLRVNGRLITDLAFEHRPPYLLETAGLKLKPPMLPMGEIYVSKLSKGSWAFRLDIDRQIAADQRIEAVQRLLGNDLVTQGYPETLRLAHILCTFTANEVLAMQHFVTRNCGLRIVNRPDMHKLLFGPFGKGEGYS